MHDQAATEHTCQRARELEATTPQAASALGAVDRVEGSEAAR